MKHLILLSEGSAKLCLWGMKDVSAVKGQQQGEGKGEDGESTGFPRLSLKKSSLQGFASHKLQILHSQVQLN